ncbi:MAG TPA: hypothetical protein VFP87_01265 [Chitinophagaceae bacterium]|nr:hypothetical protein [Chitinophagaceae bacterium]
MRSAQFFVFVLFCACTSAQVPVRDEPRHKVVLQNEYIRLLDVRIPPGDTSLYHVHEIPSFFIPLSTTITRSQVKGHEPRNWRFPIDSTWYNGFESGPLVHRVWNIDTNVLHVIDLELLSSKNSPLPETIQLPFKIDFENQKLRVYKFDLQAYQNLNLPLLKSPMLFISVEGAGAEIKDLRDKNVSYKLVPGGFQWLEPKRNFKIKNPGPTSTRSILILLK